MQAALTPIQQACQEAGGQANLARLIDVSPVVVNQWCKGIRPVPVERCAAVEKAVDGRVTRADLRPDDYWLIWPDLPAPKARKADKVGA